MLLHSWMRDFCRRFHLPRKVRYRQQAFRQPPVAQIQPLSNRLMLAATLSISDLTLTEGDSGQTQALFTVTRHGDDLSSAITFTYTTEPVGGSSAQAEAGIDYVATSSVATIPAGQNSLTLAVPVLGDRLPEPDEQFQVRLTGITGVSGATPTFASQAVFSTTHSLRGVEYGDINLDGKLDMLVTHVNGANVVSILLNTTPIGSTTPTFAAPTTFAVNGYPMAVAVSDLNGDGRPDVAVANRYGPNLSVFFNTTTPGSMTPTLSAKVDLPTGQQPCGVTIADLNGDGRQDLISANRNSASVSVFFNTTATGTTTPSFTARTDFTTGSIPLKVRAGDLNGDGRLDLAVSAEGGVASILLNTAAVGAATPSFATNVDLTAGNSPSSVSLADLDLDGRLDVVVSNTMSNDLTLLLNRTATGSGTLSFAAGTTLSVGQHTTALWVDDLNNDGKPDLVAPANNSARLVVYVNQTVPGSGVATFTKTSDLLTGQEPYGVSIADLNNDGLRDIFCGNARGSSLSVFLNTTVQVNPAPQFAARTDYGFNTSAASVALADYNLDGRPDLAVAHWKANTVSVSLNTAVVASATSSFTSPAHFNTGDNPRFVVQADFNGDGRPDLATSNHYSSTVSVLLNTTVPGSSTAGFAAKGDFSTGSNPYSVVVADFNGDGKPDLATPNRYGNSVSVLLNTTTPGATAPSFASKIDFATGTNPRPSAVGDINGDGKPDLVTGNVVANTVSVLINTTVAGSGVLSFAAKVDLTVGAAPNAIGLADLNGDDRDDIVVGNTNANTISVFFSRSTSNSSTATFETRADLSTPAGPRGIFLRDFTGDGRIDLGVVNISVDKLSVYRNTTTPGSSTPSFSESTSFATGAYPAHADAADFNGDGVLDLAAANVNGNSVSVLLGQRARLGDTTFFIPSAAPTPTFASQAVFSTTHSLRGVEYGDINLDGKLDMLVTHVNGANVVSILLNTTPFGSATPTFSAPTTFEVNGYPMAVAISDLNGDGRPDVAVANRLGQNLSVFFNTTTPRATTLTLSTRVDLTTGYEPCGVTIADLNGDGRKDLISANRNSASVSVFFNTTATGTTTPSFTARTDFTTGSIPLKVRAGDLNGDGRLDLAVSAEGGVASILLNTAAVGAATPSFATKVDLTAGNSPSSVSLADLDLDGRLDLVVSNTMSQDLTLLLNRTTTGSGTLSFAAGTTLPVGQYTTALWVDDLNNDGKPDLVAPANNSARLVVYVNQTVPGSGVATFTKTSDLLTGQEPYGVSIADLNNDGLRDIFCGNARGSSLSVFLNTTAVVQSVPQYLPRSDFNAVQGPASIITADYNLDGRPDMAVSNWRANKMTVLLNTTSAGSSTASFTPAVSFVTGENPRFIVALDVNGDGRPDLATANHYSASVSVLLNTTAPGDTVASFATRADFPVVSTPYTVAVGDFNGDGRTDLVAANRYGQSVSVLLNTTTPGSTSASFAARTDFATTPIPRVVAVGDINGDGRPDIVSVDATGRNTTVLINTTAPGSSTPTFAAGVQLPVGPNPFGIKVADLNGDRLADIVVGNLDTDSVTIHFSRSNPNSSIAQFESPVTFGSVPAARDLVCRDVTGDGRPDLVMATPRNNTVTIFRNNTPPGSSTPQFESYASIPTAKYPFGIDVADLNGDGIPDLAAACYTNALISVSLGQRTENADGVGIATIRNDDTSTPQPPQFLTPAPISVVAGETIIAALAASDSTLPSQTLSYSISGGGDASLFAITPQGLLSWKTPPTVANPVDADGNGVYLVEVTVGDGVDGTAARLFEVSLTTRVTSSPLTPEQQANQQTAQAQQTWAESPRSLARDALGRGMVTWSSQTQDGSGWGVYARRITAAGDWAGNEFLVTQTTSNDQRYSTVAATAAGDFLITWTSTGQDGDGDGIYARLFAADGTPRGNEYVVNQTTTGQQRLPSVTGNSTGLFVIAWISTGTNGVSQVWARQFSIDGVPVGNEFSVGSFAATGQTAPSVASDTAGNFVVAWDTQAEDGDQSGIAARVFSANGSPRTAQFRVNQTTSSAQSAPAVAMDANGNFVVSWTSLGQDGDGAGVYARRYDANGTALGAEFQVNVATAGAQSSSNVARDINGNFLITWTDSTADGSGTGIMAQPFLASGTRVGSPFLVNQTTSGSQGSAGVSLSPSGSSFIAWTSDGQDGSSGGVYLRTFGPPPNSVPSITSPASLSSPENAAVITTLTATDTDSPAQTLTFFVSGGPDAAQFSIHATNQLLPATPFNFEQPADSDGDNVYVVRVRVEDGAGGVAYRWLTVTVTNTNEAPSAISLSNNSIAENQPANTTIGTLSTTDPDSGETFTYTLVSGTGDVDNGSFVIAGNTLRSNTVFDYETRNSYTLRVRTTDAGGLWFERQFTISVTNANDAPTQVSLSNVVSTLLANTSTANAIRLADLSVTDDGEGTNTLGLSGADAGVFEIVNNQLRLKTGTLLNYATKQTYSVTVTVDDSTVGGTPDASVNYTLSLQGLDGTTVQNGAAGRSFVRYVSLNFGNTLALANAVASVGTATPRIRLFFAGTTGTQSIARSLTGMVSVVGNQVRLDFGSKGVGGDPNSSLGDGVYRIRVDLDGDGQAEITASFFRLFGDVDGNGVVNDTDIQLVTTAQGLTGLNLSTDLNGDGFVNSVDLTNVKRRKGARVTLP